MGLSSNQARFLALTSRQVDLEHRIQQICQRRLRLTSELENVATSYNNKISNRKMFTPSTAGIQNLSFVGLQKLGYNVIDQTGNIVNSAGLMNRVGVPSTTATAINTEQDFINLLAVINGGGAASTNALADNYVLKCDIDLSDNGTFNKNVIGGVFTGTFDGQGHTISGANITTNGAQTNIGLFMQNTGTIKNLGVADINISSTADNTAAPYSFIGVLTAYNKGIIDNVSVTDSNITLGNNYKIVGGFVGQNGSGGNITNSYATTEITTGNFAQHVGGFVGDPSATSKISNCYSTGDLNLGHTANYIGGFRGGYDDNFPSTCTITNSYCTGDVTVGNWSNIVGGFTSESNSSGSSTTNSYYAGTVTAGAGSSNVGGFTGSYTNGVVNSTNFYQSNVTDAPGSSATTDKAVATSGWNPDIWDMSGALPTLHGTSIKDNDIEEGLRDGTLSLAREADEFTQDPLDINGKQYQEIDWRATPEVFDELYKGDDVEAENKYDKTVDEINSQDKKLQLEQTTIEVEYKAISSERESVKKILETNAQSSFKYFS